MGTTTGLVFTPSFTARLMAIRWALSAARLMNTWLALARALETDPVPEEIVGVPTNVTGPGNVRTT